MLSSSGVLSLDAPRSGCILATEKESPDGTPAASPFPAQGAAFSDLSLFNIITVSSFLSSY